MAKEKLNYGEAIERLEQIVAQIERNDLDIDSLGVKLKEAKELVDFCKKRLFEVDEEVKKLLQGEEDE
jgi:exodeoxyribonuclease VII small subunit